MAERLECEVLVVGAGPAGLAAAFAAASRHARVILADENPLAGGQIWRATGTTTQSKTDSWLAKLAKHHVRIIGQATVFDFPQSDLAAMLIDGKLTEIQFQKCVLATGARELFLPFPGWTLPGVFGVGGLQALAKQRMPIRGKRIVVAGSGPLLLAVAHHLDEAGAHILGIYEQAPTRKLREFSLGLWRHPAKLGQAFGMLWTAQKLRLGWWVKRATGEGRLTAVEVTNGAMARTLPCDYLACAYGLVPNIELAKIACCELSEGFVDVDSFQRTTNERVFCAGEPVKIGGVDAAVVQGTIAGLAATGGEASAKSLFYDRDKCHCFAHSLTKAFELRPEVLQLPEDSTIVCRCEDVRYGALKDLNGFREAKLLTRAGMGPCQGRICGEACRALFGWEAPAVRPPAVPVPIGALVGVNSAGIGHDRSN